MFAVLPRKRRHETSTIQLHSSRSHAERAARGGCSRLARGQATSTRRDLPRLQLRRGYRSVMWSSRYTGAAGSICDVAASGRHQTVLAANAVGLFRASPEDKTSTINRRHTPTLWGGRGSNPRPTDYEPLGPRL